MSYYGLLSSDIHTFFGLLVELLDNNAATYDAVTFTENAENIGGAVINSHPRELNSDFKRTGPLEFQQETHTTPMEFLASV